MALIKCPECGKEISDKATVCPSCGFPIAEERPPACEQLPVEPVASELQGSLSEDDPAAGRKRKTVFYGGIAFCAVMVIVLIVGVFLRFGPSTSSQLNANNERTAKVVLNAVDAYLDGTADAAETLAIIEGERENVDEDDHYGPTFDTYLLLLETDLNLEVLTDGGDVANIKDYRNTIADMIGVSAYK